MSGNIGDEAGPCPRCKGPTKVLGYDEGPDGTYRGNYEYSCETCGEFGMEFGADPDRPWLFRRDGLLPEDEVTKVMPIGQLTNARELAKSVSFAPPTLGSMAKYCLPLAATKRCQRCGRLEETCDSGLYGDCVDYRR